MADEDSVAHENIQYVMQDILAIRRSITSFQNGKEGQIGETSFRANAIMYMVALAFMALFIGIEVFNNRWITRTMIQSSFEPQASGRGLVVTAIGLFLVLCLVIMYFVIGKAATRSAENLNDYIKRNFVYLQNLNHISDLLVKFVVVAALIIGGMPNWVAPFLFLFTGDYLLQGRYFILRIRTAQILAVVSFLGAAAMFYLRNPAVLYPLIWFFIVTVISLRHLMKLKRVEG